MFDKLYKSRVFPVLLISLFFLLSFFAANGFSFLNKKFYSGYSITLDEVSHIGDGVYYWKEKRMFLNPEHPILPKLIASLPVILSNPEYPKFSENAKPFEADAENYLSYPIDKNELLIDKNLEFDYSGQWIYGKTLLFNENNNLDQILFLSRTMILIVNTLLISILYLFIKKISSRKAALIVLCFISTSTLLLAHASLVTMDAMAALSQVLASLSFGILFQKLVKDEKYLKWFFISVGFFIIAQLSKFSSIMLLPVFGIFILYCIFNFRKTKFKEIIVVSISFFVLSFLLISLIYLPFTSNASVNEINYMISLKTEDRLPAIAQIFYKITSLGGIFKSFMQYTYGIMLTFGRAAGGSTTYFFGEVYTSGKIGLPYFIILFIAKNAEGFILLLLSTISIFFYRYFQIVSKKYKNLNILISKIYKNIKITFSENYSFVILSLFGMLYLLSAFITKLQIGVRHIMVIFVIVYILAAVLFSKLDLTINLKRFFSFLIALCFISTLIAFPNFINFYGVEFGGVEKGYKVAVDSNYDWGQDLEEFGQWADNIHDKPIYYELFTNDFPERYTLTSLNKFNRFNLPKENSYIAVSIHVFQNWRYGDDMSLKNLSKELESNLIKRIGKTIFVFELN